MGKGSLISVNNIYLLSGSSSNSPHGFELVFLYSYSLVFGRQASTRFISSLLSLPVPPGNPHGAKEDPTIFSGRSVPKYLEQGRVQKLLLFGLEGSGTSTIFKQVCHIFLKGSKQKKSVLVLA